MNGTSNRFNMSRIDAILKTVTAFFHSISQLARFDGDINRPRPPRRLIV